MGVNNYQTILRIELNDQICYSEHHLMVPEHFYCWVAGSFKKDDAHLLNNYRPISPLPTISKVFEKVVQEQLTEFLNVNKLLYNSQYGFRKAHSTETATLELIDTLLQTLDKKDIPISIFLYLSKAFDTIDHKILYVKLRHYGINGVLLNWLINYLTGRQQFVKLDDEISNTLPISTGVPQGSILGPLLFHTTSKEPVHTCPNLGATHCQRSDTNHT